MHPGAPAGKRCGTIHDHFAFARDNPQQGGSGIAFPAAKTGSYGFHTRPTHGEPLPAPQHSGTAESGGVASMLPYLDCSS